MGLDLTNQYIDETFQKLVQVSGSNLTDGTGSVITNLDIAVTQASAATIADTATSALNATTADSATTAQTAISSSYATNAQTATNAVSASIAGTANIALIATSASHALNADNSISSSYAVSAGSSLTSNTSISSSHSIQADTSSLLIGNAEQVSHIDMDVAGDTGAERRLTWNEADGTLDIGLKGGNVTLQVGQELVTRVVNKSGVDLLEANYQVVQIQGSQGQRLSVELASADGIDAQTTLGVVTETINNNQEGFITTNGLVREIDTRGPGLETWIDGDPLYLSDTIPGGLTNIKPTAPSQLVKVGFVINAAPNGSIYVKIEVGTALTELYDATIISASSGDLLVYNEGTSVWENSTTLGGTYNINVANITSASIGYLQSVTGSATIIGDSIIVLNNDTPTQRYAGLAVYDSGSTGVTASLEFDGLSNDWFYEYSDDGGVTTDHGVVLFGPEYSVKGTPTYPTNNRIQKGNGGHHLLDSTITDTGTAISTTVGITAPSFTGSLNGNADSATTATTAITATSASYATVAENLTPGNKILVGAIDQQFPAPADNTQFNLVTVSGATGGNTDAPYNNFSFGIQNYPGFGNVYKDAYVVEKYDSFGYNYGSDFAIAGSVINAAVAGRNGGYGVVQIADEDAGLVKTTIRGNQLINFADGAGGYTDQFYSHPTSGRQTQIVLREFLGDNTQSEISLNADNIGIGQASAQSGGNGAITIGNNTTTTLINLIGDKIVTEGRSTNKNTLAPITGTYNLDLSLGNAFELPIIGDVTITPINVEGTNAQTTNVIIDNVGGSAVTFSGVLWPGGTAPTLGAGLHVVTLLTGTGTRVLGTAVETLS